MVVRLLNGLRAPMSLEAPVRAARAEAARQWLIALSLPAKARTAFQRAFAISASEDPAGAADALEAVTEVTAPHLDRSARSEMGRLVASLRSGAVQLAGVRERPVE